MDHPAGVVGAEDRVPGGLLSPDRHLLRGVPRLAWGEGKDVSLPAALSAALASAEARDRAYDDAAAVSGIAFQLRIDDRWDPDTVGPHAKEAVERAAAALGARADVLEPPHDDELFALAWERVVESVDAGLPPLARGLLGLPEFGVIVGYDVEARVLFARTYNDHGVEPSRLGWDDARGAIFAFFDRGSAPSEAQLAREAVGRAVEVSAPATLGREEVHLYAGEDAYRAWIAGLEQEVPPKEAAQRAFVDHARRVLLHDARRAAARFLRRVRRHFPERAGAELIRAAEAYGYVADEAEKAGIRPFEASVVARFLDPSLRRGWAHGLERALKREREAIAALRGAVALVH